MSDTLSTSPRRRPGLITTNRCNEKRDLPPYPNDGPRCRDERYGAHARGPGLRRDDGLGNPHDRNSLVYWVSWRRPARSARKVALPRSSRVAASARCADAATTGSSAASTRWLSV